MSGLTLSDEEADAILSQWGLTADLPEDILEAFRAAARDVAAMESQPAGYSSASTAGFGMMSAGWSPPPFPNPDCTKWSFSNSTSYEDWIAFFDVPDPENPTGPTLLDGHTGFHDSFANDGLPNILKYALGLDPTKDCRICLPHPEFVEDQNETYLAVRFTRPDWVTGVMHTLESSPDLFVWSQHHDPDPVEITDPISNSSYEEVRLLDLEPFDPYSRRFLRLRNTRLDDVGQHAIR